MWITNLKVFSVAVIVVAFYTVVASVIPQLESEVPEELELSSDVTPEALVAAGERIYNGAGGCAACHELGTRAPNLLADHAGEGPIGARCGTRISGVRCKQYLYQSLTDPGAVVVAGFENIMPDMRRQLPEDQVWAVVAFLESLGGVVTVTAADLPRERETDAATSATPAQTFTMTTDPEELIREKGCVGCHQLAGAGAPVGPSFDGMGGRITADRIRRGILDPNGETAEGFDQLVGVMPTFFGEQLSAAQLEAIVQFLAELR